ncbi:MAG: ECF transporter S component [Coprobacillus sp.]|nr:ECF transporter S component [Coprobacillus sp.]
MSTTNIVRMVIAIVLILVVLVYVYYKHHHHGHVMTLNLIARTAIFSSFSVILYVVPYLKFPLPIFPSFLEIHFDEVPALIATFAYGTNVGVAIIFIKTVIKLPFTTTLCVGELADLLYGLVLVIPAGMWYKRHHNFKGGLVASIIGAVIQIAVASFVTSWPILDFYMAVMGFTEEQILYMCQLVNSNVTSLGWTFLLWVALPFNALKDVIVVVLTLLLYRALRSFIDKAYYGRKKSV